MPVPHHASERQRRLCTRQAPRFGDGGSGRVDSEWESAAHSLVMKLRPLSIGIALPRTKPRGRLQQFNFHCPPPGRQVDRRRGGDVLQLDGAYDLLGTVLLMCFPYSAAATSPLRPRPLSVHLVYSSTQVPGHWQCILSRSEGGRHVRGQQCLGRSFCFTVR